MPALTRESAKAQVDKLAREPIDLPTLGGSCWAEELNGLHRTRCQRLRFEYEEKQKGLGIELSAAIAAVQGLVTEDGTRIFKDGDEEWLARTHALDVDKALEVIDRLTGGVFKVREELKKSSEPTDTSAGSDTAPASGASPSTSSSSATPAAS